MDKSFEEFKHRLEKMQKDIFKPDGWLDAPFDFDREEARVWNIGRKDLIQWVLEMFPNG